FLFHQNQCHNRIRFQSKDRLKTSPLDKAVSLLQPINEKVNGGQFRVVGFDCSYV
ncbi:MAG: hypothetical protein US81_C0020G0008, partial [Parcubacteria group bacterium GW2011_GWE2_38_18]